MATTNIPTRKFWRRYTLRFIALVRSLRFVVVVSCLLLSPTAVVVRVEEGLFRREDADDNIERGRRQTVIPSSCNLVHLSCERRCIIMYRNENGQRKHEKRAKVFFVIILIFVTVNQSFTNSGNGMSENPEVNQPTKSICLRCSLFNNLPRAHAHRRRRRRRKAARRTRTSNCRVFSHQKTPQKRTHERGVLSSNQIIINNSGKLSTTNFSLFHHECSSSLDQACSASSMEILPGCRKNK